MDTLLVYTTRNGCTEKCANMLLSKLKGKVDMFSLQAEKRRHIGIRAVIVGSPVLCVEDTKAPGILRKKAWILKRKRSAFYLLYAEG
jgi:menaquinone-dependent protoporphyrinogen oxidase